MRASSCLVSIVVIASACHSPEAINKARVDALASTRWDGAKQVPAPPSLAMRRLQVGQWAIYKSTYQGFPLAFERMSVIAEDRCGTWIELVQEYEPVRSTWLVCARWQPQGSYDWQAATRGLQQAIRRVNDQPPELIDFRDGRNSDLQTQLTALTRHWFLLARTSLPEQTREDVTVAAGRLAGAVREHIGDLDVWSHPDVPFGGVIKVSDARGEDVLMAYGFDGGHSDTPDLQSLLLHALQSRARSCH